MGGNIPCSCDQRASPKKSPVPISNKSHLPTPKNNRVSKFNQPLTEDKEQDIERTEKSFRESHGSVHQLHHQTISQDNSSKVITSEKYDTTKFSSQCPKCKLFLDSVKIGQLKDQYKFPVFYQRPCNEIATHEFICNIVSALNAIRRFFPHEMHKIIKIQSQTIQFCLWRRKQRKSLEKIPRVVIVNLNVCDCKLYQQFEKFRQLHNNKPKDQKQHSKNIQDTIEEYWAFFLQEKLISSIIKIYEQEQKMQAKEDTTKGDTTKEDTTKGYDITRIFGILFKNEYCCIQTVLKDPSEKMAKYVLKLFLDLKQQQPKVRFLTFGTTKKGQTQGHAGIIVDESNCQYPEKDDPTPIEIEDNELSTFTIYVHAILPDNVEPSSYFEEKARYCIDSLKKQFKGDNIIFKNRYYYYQKCDTITQKSKVKPK